MIQYFYIASLQRSRSSWLSMLLSHGDVVCMHDQISTLPRIHHDALYDSMHKEPASFYGIVDTALPQSWRDLAPALRAGRTVSIRRDPAEVERSVRALFPMLDVTRALKHDVDGLDAFEAAFDPLVISYDTLDDPEVQERLWAYVTHNVRPFPAAHAKRVTRLHIEPRLDKYTESMSPSFVARAAKLLRS